MSSRIKGITGSIQRRAPYISPALNRVMKKFYQTHDTVKPKHSEHFSNKKGCKKTSDVDIYSIRKLQHEGIKKRIVRAQFEHISDSSFENIWSGFTAAHISHLTPIEES